MRYWKYKIVNRANIGTEENPLWHEAFFEKRLPYTEANEEIAKKEAYNGEYEIYDDGKPEPEAPATLENRVETLETDTADMAEALDMILSGVTE